MLRRGRCRRERGVWGEEEGKKCGGSETGLLGDGARTGAAPPCQGGQRDFRRTEMSNRGFKQLAVSCVHVKLS